MNVAGDSLGTGGVCIDIYKGQHCLHPARERQKGAVVVWGIYSSWFAVWSIDHLLLGELLPIIQASQSVHLGCMKGGHGSEKQVFVFFQCGELLQNLYEP